MPLTMPRAFQIGRFLGVPVYVTWSWLLFVAVIVPLYTRQLRQVESRLPVAIALSVVLALMWGVAVLVHEFGHVAAAVSRDLPVRRVELGFLGGETQIRTRDDSARDEFWLAASGPLVSLVLGLPGLVSLISGAGLSFGLTGKAGLFASAFTIANLAIGLFNLLPGLPLDGGRILVAALWRGRRDRIAATRLAARGGQGVSILLGAAGVLAIITSRGDLAMRLPLVVALAIMSAVLWAMAGTAIREADVEQTLQARGIGELIDAADAVPADLTVAGARSTTSSEIVLVYGAGPTGYLTRDQLVDVAAGTPVSAVAHPLGDEQVLTENATRLDLLRRLQDSPREWYAVVARDGLPIGIVGSAALSRH
ncbi:hypothetical protein EK0264_18470 [Epidermidibacterium keratini]|uniref:Zinc metalloprotease n=1 Tax=Epidermidibacterium keratini TaxID=1891644 RepID=A0A7L4YSJ3_9ACTN|nr:site-2 protease family protein [Epidermidibacterium keratini]QHC02060.1 hypothetical protein EK0264_18470 [Epidermidibacterium keratini]